MFIRGTAESSSPASNLVTNLGHGVFATHTHNPAVRAANLATTPIHHITHPPRFHWQAPADFEVFCARYYLEGPLARREGPIPAFRETDGFYRDP